MDKKTLKAEERKLTGRKVKTLRKSGLIPGNIYGNKIKSTAIQLDKKEFEKVYSEVGETGLVDLKVGSESRPVLIHQVQLHPVLGEAIHVDFFQVNLKEKVEADVKVELVGEAPAVKQGLGTVVLQLNEIKVEALPADLPDKFDVNIESLTEVDQAIYVKDLDLDKTKVEIKSDLDAIVVKVEPPQKEEVVETPIVPVGAEGVVPAEGPGDNSQESSKEEDKK